MWILGLAVATAVAVILTLLDPPGGVQRPRSAGAHGGDGGLTEVLPQQAPLAPAGR